MQASTLCTVVIENDPRQAVSNLLKDYYQSFRVTNEKGLSDRERMLKSDSTEVVVLNTENGIQSVIDSFRQLLHTHGQVVLTTDPPVASFEDVEVSALDCLVQHKKVDQLMREVARSKRLVIKLSQDKKNKTATAEPPLTTYRDRIVIKTSDAYHIVKKKNIIRCEADVNYTKIHLSNGRPIISARTLKQYERMLGRLPFLRVHQSHLVNIDHLLRYEKRDGGTLILADQQEVPVSKGYKDGLLCLLNQFDAISTNNK